jgi:hypothetical protein
LARGLIGVPRPYCTDQLARQGTSLAASYEQQEDAQPMNTNKEGTGSNGTTSTLVNSVDQMVRLPLEMTGATWDFMMQGMRSMTGRRSSTGADHEDSSSSNGSNSSSSSSSSATSTFTGQNNQDLSGDDLKYVIWSIVFTKPGFECVLEPQHSEIVNYSADGSSYAAVKIAKFLEKARHGHVEKTETWTEHGYPPEPAKAGERRTDTITMSDTSTTVNASTAASASSSSSRDRGWRIPADDQKYITFLYRIDWRLPKQEDVARVERVTIERGTTRIA